MLPPEVTTCALTFGKSYNILGEGATVEVTIKPSHHLTWVATGDQIPAFHVSSSVEKGVIGQLDLPHTDQDGFMNWLGKAFTNWHYVADIVTRLGSQSVMDRKVFSLASGQETVDLDLLPSEGQVSAPGIATMPEVLTVNRQTGNVEIAVLPEGGEPGQIPVRTEDGVEWGAGGGGATDESVQTLIDDPESATRASLLGTIGAEVISKDLAPSSAVTGTSPGALWQSPGEPAAPELATMTHGDHLARWDALVAEHPGYVTRTDLGPGSDGAHRVYRYEFTPPNPEKTIILTGMLHGSERVGTYALLRVMEQVANQWQQHAALAYLRHAVRVVVLPVINNLDGRKNANGVDLNRNFPWNWTNAPSDPADIAYRGTAPLSEPEAQYVDQTITEYAASLVGGIDAHDVGMNYATDPRSFYVGSPNYIHDVRRDWSTNVVDTMRGPGDSPPTMSMGDSATLTNYAGSLGYNWATAEYEQGAAHSGQSLSAPEMTRAVSWYGALITELAHTRKPVLTVRHEPFVRAYEYRSGSSQIPMSLDGTTSLVEILELRDEFEFPGDGLVVYEGDVSIVGRAGIIRVQPVVSMLDGGIVTQAPASRDERQQTMVETTSRNPIYFRVATPVYRLNNHSGDNKVRAALWLSSSESGTHNVLSYHAQVTFYPASGAGRFKRFTATGRGGTGVGAMQQNWPV